MHLMWGPHTVSARPVEDVQDLCGARRRVDRLHRGRDADGKNAARMERLAPRGGIAPQSPAQGVDANTRGGGDAVDGPWPRLAQGPHLARITRLARGDALGQEKAGSGLGQEAGFAPKRGRAMACALHDGGHGGGRRMPDFALGELFTLGQAPRLLGELPRRGAGSVQVTTQTRTLRLPEGAVLTQARLGVLGPGRQATAQVQQALCGRTHPRDAALALAPALTTKATPDLVQGLLQRLRWVLQSGGRARALLTDPLDAVQAFFGALSSVVASVTRGRPCAEGQGSTRRWAGLTRPASMAAAAWSAPRSSIQS
jgi:hypothetical protein